ncbi:response regulator [Leptolyngbya sp. FACHB-8]|uniref:hybrid sensor histidine kinase/response regulator n=1 Tax=unclassified Leptolyngbya TaxID=2650499 RepID=UPI001685C975|nr:response regulator [Leptolyngbya sp. FACHB-8]MBD1909368.1 response regulator [Leptolyngbya sp. FACHB-8]
MSTDTAEQGVILIVDDKPANLSVLFEFLADAGFQILVAEDSDGAIETAKYAAPDLILLDILMPEIDGFETCRRLKQDGQTKEIPVIFLTALNETVDKVRGLELGAVDYLTKPLQEEEVLARVRIHLSIRKLTRQLQSQNLQLEQEIAERKQIEARLQHQTTELIQREEALRETSQKLQAIVQSAPLAILVLDPQGYVKMWNRAAEKTFGWHESEVLGCPLPIVQKNKQEEFHSLLQQGLQGQSLTQVEVRRQKRDGTDIDISISTAPLQDTDGQISGIMAVLMDITERRQTEQKIHEQAALLDITTDAIFVRNLDNQISFWNKGAERLYGWLAEEILGKSANCLSSNKDISQLAEAQKVVARQGEWQGRLWQLTKNGSKVVVESRWTLVKDENDHPKSILVVNTDVTEKQQLEAQFLRTQRIQSIGTLAGGIAHDLNNLLTPILASVQLMQMQNGLQDEKKELLLKTIEQNTKRGAALIKQVLSFARGMEGQRTVVQVKHLITEIKQTALETFPKTIDIQTNVISDLWTVFGDATQLHQVLLNLCINASDAMPRGGTLNIKACNLLVDNNYARLHLDAKVGPYLVIAVSDTGTGIPPEVMEHIFEPFFTTKEFGKGTGLGLSTVHMIVKGHGGFVDVASSVGQGTRVKIYLPAIHAIEPVQSEEPKIPLGNGELILVVDDEEAIRETCKISLEAYNYRVLTASDGMEAIALYNKYQHEIQLVVIDLMMPKMDGRVTVPALRRINRDIKIIGMSGLLSNNHLPGSVNSYMKAFLPKPIAITELLPRIRQIL